MKRIKWVAVVALLLVCSVGSSVLAANQFLGFPVVRLIINGKEIQGAVPPIVIEGRTMLPVRDVAQALGATVAWDEATQTVTLTGESSDALAQTNRKLNERIAGLLVENADLKLKLARATPPPPPPSPTPPPTPAPTRTLRPAGAKAVPVDKIVIIGTTRSGALLTEGALSLLYKDGDNLYIETQSAGLLLSVVADIDSNTGAPMTSMNGVQSQITRVHTDEKDLKSPWYTRVEIRFDRERRKVEFDTRGTAFEHAERMIPIPFPLQELLTKLGLNATATYDETAKTLTIRRQ